MDAETQIKILEKVLDKLINPRNIEKLGLCTLISREIKEELHLENAFPTYTLINVEGYIPLFTRLNANKYAYGRTSGWYWWPFTNEYDSINRIVFIKWMISKLKDEK